jgi:hypothetical protein
MTGFRWFKRRDGERVLVVREEGCTEREADCFRVSVDGSPHFFSGWVLEGAGESSSLAFGV